MFNMDRNNSQGKVAVKKTDTLTLKTSDACLDCVMVKNTFFTMILYCK